MNKGASSYWRLTLIFSVKTDYDKNWQVSSANYDHVTYFNAKNKRRVSAWKGTLRLGCSTFR